MIYPTNPSETSPSVPDCTPASPALTSYERRQQEAAYQQQALKQDLFGNLLALWIRQDDIKRLQVGK